MTLKRLTAAAVAACLGVTVLTGCGVPANKVFSVNDLPGKSIGVQQGTTGDDLARSYEEEPEAGAEPAKVERYNKGADAVSALKQGKIDCVIIDNEPAKVFVSNNDDLQILSDSFEPEDYAIAVKKNNGDLVERLNAAMAELKADGTIDKILANYIGDNTGSYQYTSPEGTDRSNGKLVMATNAEFPPYESLEDGNIVGIDPDIFTAICDKLGYEPVIDDMAFDSIIPAIQSGKADIGMAGMTVDPTRLESVDFTDSYATGLQVIITRVK